MKRILVLLTVALVMVAMMVASAVPAMADATPNGGNCHGVDSSNLAPEVVSHGQEGLSASTHAHESPGAIGEFERARVAFDKANCH